ncbi:hypothetical protein CIG19_18800 [Enterobacterales bacterium CwR94]|nr:hypothetical protein CIG19_18800 [Enterobacterales bacterium CwR94]
MFIHTDLLRAALCCVADSKEERRYLQGIHITSTHIQACNKIACVSMEHGDKNPFEGVFIVIGMIPPEAEGTFINLVNETVVAMHVTEDNQVVGRNILEPVECQYPNFSNLLAGEPEPISGMPIFKSRLLALPDLMFGPSLGVVVVGFKSWGKDKPCQLIFDKAVNHLFGNPMMVIMPMTESAFELIEEAFDETGI